MSIVTVAQQTELKQFHRLKKSLSRHSISDDKNKIVFNTTIVYNDSINFKVT
jgi:hypothetical protein